MAPALCTAPAPDAVRPAPGPIDAAGSLPVAIVVDDDACLRALLGDWVESCGFLAVGVGGGPAAVEAVKYLAPSVVIADLHLEGMAGHETIAAVRAIDPGVRILVATADDDPEALIRAVDAGADDVLVKPFDHGVLAAALRCVRVPGSALPFRWD